MKKRALLLVVACALILSAQPVFAVGTCADWEGAWTFNYVKDGVTTCDNITFTVCNNEDGSNPSCLPVKEGSPQTYWLCVARGKKQSDNKTVQVRRISFDPTNFVYYEKTDDEMFVLGSDTPSDYLPAASFTGTEFTVNNASNKIPADTGIGCGTKGKVECKECGAAACLLKVIPGKIIKLLKFANPISGIILIGDGTYEFAAGDTPEYDTTAIIPLLKVKIGTKIMISLVFVNPLSQDSGQYGVAVGDCSGVIEIK